MSHKCLGWGEERWMQTKQTNKQPYQKPSKGEHQNIKINYTSFSGHRSTVVESIRAHKNMRGATRGCWTHTWAAEDLHYLTPFQITFLLQSQALMRSRGPRRYHEFGPITHLHCVWVCMCVMWKGQGSISMGSMVRMVSSLPRRTTTLSVASLLMAALTSVAVAIRWPLMEMMTSCSLRPPLHREHNKSKNQNQTQTTLIRSPAD